MPRKQYMISPALYGCGFIARCAFPLPVVCFAILRLAGIASALFGAAAAGNNAAVNTDNQAFGFLGAQVVPAPCGDACMTVGANITISQISNQIAQSQVSENPPEHLLMGRFHGIFAGEEIFSYMHIGFFQGAAEGNHFMNDGFLQHVIGHSQLLIALLGTAGFNQIDGSRGIQVAEGADDILADKACLLRHDHLPVERRDIGQIHIDIADIIESCADPVHDGAVGFCIGTLLMPCARLLSAILRIFEEVRHFAARAACRFVDAAVDFRVRFIGIDEARFGGVNDLIVIKT